MRKIHGVLDVFLGIFEKTWKRRTGEILNVFNFWSLRARFAVRAKGTLISDPRLRADFREGDEDSNFSIFRLRRFSEWPEPLH